MSSKKLFEPRTALESVLDGVYFPIVNHYTSHLSHLKISDDVVDPNHYRFLMSFSGILEGVKIYFYNDRELQEKYPNSFTDGNYLFLNTDQILDALNKDTVSSITNNFSSLIISVIPTILKHYKLVGDEFNVASIGEYIKSAKSSEGYSHHYNRASPLSELSDSYKIDFVSSGFLNKSLIDMGFADSVAALYPQSASQTDLYSEYYIYNQDLVKTIYKKHPEKDFSAIDKIVDGFVVAAKNNDAELAAEIVRVNNITAPASYDNMGLVLTSAIASKINADIIGSVRKKIKSMVSEGMAIDSWDFIHDDILKAITEISFISEYLNCYRGELIGNVIRNIINEVLKVSDENVTANIITKIGDYDAISTTAKRGLVRYIWDNIPCELSRVESDDLSAIIAGTRFGYNELSAVDLMYTAMKYRPLEECIKDISGLTLRENSKLIFNDYLMFYFESGGGHSNIVDGYEKYNYIINNDLYDLDRVKPKSAQEFLISKILVTKEREILNDELDKDMANSYKSKKTPKERL